jgi:hypothetical protein
MPDGRQQIREFIEAGARPVTADEIVANGRAPMGRSPDRAVRGIRRLGLYGAVAVPAAILALIIGLAVAPSGVTGHAPPGDIASVLARAADGAATEPALVPGPAAYLYVRTLTGTIDFAASSPGKPLEQFYVEEVDQTWSNAHGLGAQRVDGVGRPRFVSGADRSAWRADGSKPLRAGVGAGTEVNATAGSYDVTDLPTDPARLPAYFARQRVLPPRPSSGSDAMWLFSSALAYLQHGASSTQRAALLRFIATIPGVEDKGAARSLGTGQPGTLLSLAPAQRDQGSTAVQAVLDVTTSALREVRTVDLGHGGHIESYSDFLAAGLTGATDAMPAGVPSLPAAWPHGTAREPAPGSVYR